MTKPSGADHFELGPRYCLFSFQPVDECVHCKLQPAPPHKPKLVVADVDREAGVITYKSVPR